MSNIDTNTHTVTTYISGVTKAFTGQRLATVTFKTSKDKNSLYFGMKRESRAVSIPQITNADIESNMVLLLPHVKELVQGVQDKIVREAITANDGLLHVTQESIGMAAVIEYLEDSNESGRLTKEAVGEWFKENVMEMLMMTLAEKLGVSAEPTQEESDKVEKIVSEFQGKISSLAGGKTSYPAKMAAQLKKAVEMAPESDVLRERFVVRLGKMMREVSENDLLNAL